MNPTRILLAVGLLVAAIAFVFVYKYSTGNGNVAGLPALSCSGNTVVRGFYGGEKSSFIADEEVKSILLNRYCLSIDGKKAGSTEMVTTQPLGNNDDFIWPSNSVSLAIYKNRQGLSVGSANIFNSPMVFYTRKPIAEALIKQGVVTVSPEGYAQVTDLEKFISFATDGKKWRDIGVDMPGSVSIRTTDPNISNSGFMFLGMLANIYNNGAIPTEAEVQQEIARIKTFFQRLGFMDQSSSDLFQQYVTTGMGSRPIIVGYESQLIEFALSNPGRKTEIESEFRMLYPMPTMWSSHPFVARSSAGKRLLEALKDPDLQRIAWTRHGFRSGLEGAKNDPKALNVSGIPADINSVTDMPSPSVMEFLLLGIR